jgi:hypothetical protein
MRPELKARILRVADTVRVFRYYEELVKDMARFSNIWNSTSDQMTKGLQDRDIDMLSKAILEGRKEAARLSYVLQRHERVVAKLGDKNET